MTAVESQPGPTDALWAESDAEAVEWLHREGCTDGLPVVVPRPELVDRMVLASGVDADVSFGIMGPGGGETTMSKVAANAVMAGCTPDHLPVVIAAIQAMLRTEFDLGEMQGTTHCIAPLLVVNGPARRWSGLVSGFGALGPGHRANASIGRALRLCMINIGMARSGESDMALLGHGGKFTSCLAEAEELSPWAPQHTDHGYRPEQSAVTVIGTEPPHSVLFTGDADDPSSAERLLATLAAALANVGSNNVYFGGGGQVVILNPEHARVLADAGLDRSDVKHRLAAMAVRPLSELARFNPAFVPPPGDDPHRPRRAVRSPDDLLVVVAGGPGLYSAVMPSWAAGANMNTSVHAEIVTGQVCEVPQSNLESRFRPMR